VDQQEVRAVPVQELPGLSDELEELIRTAALQDARVAELLGERYVHLGTEPLIAKGRPADCAEPTPILVSFFSYTRNVAVEALMAGTRVQTVSAREGYQPPEAEEEIQEAICLAREDSRISDRVQLLRATAILLPSFQEEAGYGHRMLWVTFTEASDSENDELPALFSAAVDMVDRVVLMARAEPSIQDLAVLMAREEASVQDPAGSESDA